MVDSGVKELLDTIGMLSEEKVENALKLMEEFVTDAASINPDDITPENVGAAEEKLEQQVSEILPPDIVKKIIDEPIDSENDVIVKNNRNIFGKGLRFIQKVLKYMKNLLKSRDAKIKAEEDLEERADVLEDKLLSVLSSQSGEPIPTLVESGLDSLLHTIGMLTSEEPAPTGLSSIPAVVSEITESKAEDDTGRPLPIQPVTELPTAPESDTIESGINNLLETIGMLTAQESTSVPAPVPAPVPIDTSPIIDILYGIKQEDSQGLVERTHLDDYTNVPGPIGEFPEQSVGNDRFSEEEKIEKESELESELEPEFIEEPVVQSLKEEKVTDISQCILREKTNPDGSTEIVYPFAVIKGQCYYSNSKGDIFNDKLEIVIDPV